MIESKRKDTNITEENEYPCLMIGIESGNIYLITSFGKGFYVHIDKNHIQSCVIGKEHYHLDMNFLELYNGSVVLNNRI